MLESLFFSSICCLTISFKVSTRSEEHTSELQSQSNLVCRLLLEKKNSIIYTRPSHGPNRTKEYQHGNHLSVFPRSPHSSPLCVFAHQICLPNFADNHSL